MSVDEDRDLVSRCLKGDEKAFETIVDKYEKIVYNVAVRMGTSPEDAEDVTQTVFIKVFEGLSSFNSKYKFFSWIYRIAVNESLNAVNRHGRFEKLDHECVSNDRSP